MKPKRDLKKEFVVILDFDLFKEEYRFATDEEAKAFMRDCELRCLGGIAKYLGKVKLGAQST